MRSGKVRKEPFHPGNLRWRVGGGREVVTRERDWMLENNAWFVPKAAGRMTERKKAQGKMQKRRTNQ